MSGTFQCVYLDDMPRSISALSLMAMSSLITPDIASLAATTTDTKTHTPSPLRAPQAVLLDFGGVIFETSKYPDRKCVVSGESCGVWEVRIAHTSPSPM